MKRTLDGATKKGSKGPKKERQWTNKEEIFLRAEVMRSKETDWKSIKKNFNKQFAPLKRTINSCKRHWIELNSALTFNEEIIILLTLYRGNLKVARNLLENRVDVDDYVSKLVTSVNSIAEQINHFVPMPLLTKLQFFVCVDLALNVADKSDILFEEIRRSKNDWLEIVQLIINKTEKMTKEDFHEYVNELISNLEEKFNLLLTQEDNEIKEIMHERKEDPAQRSALHFSSIVFPNLRNIHHLIGVRIRRSPSS